MGKLIVFEGTDGTGKSTQFALLTKRLQNENVSFRRLQFPQYLEPSSALIRMYLNGEFGENPNDVNAYAASTFYAVDRFASYQRVWKNDYASGGLILSDRYTTSNAVHQGGKLEGKAREEFFSWLYDLEFNRMGLPKPDLVLWLDMPVEIAETLKNLYRTGEADEIHLVYQRFDSVLHQTPVHRQLLPAAPEADAPAANNNYLFVPDAQTVLDNVLELYLNNTVYAVMLEARVGEHAARMTAMTAATDSTAELIEELNLDFNRARQAAITTEISEIVGGSAALKQSQGSD